MRHTSYTMIREIRLYGDPVLAAPAETVPEITQEVRDVLTDMWDTMTANHCVGLSAPQIGVSLRLFVINARRHGDPGCKPGGTHGRCAG